MTPKAHRTVDFRWRIPQILWDSVFMILGKEGNSMSHLTGPFKGCGVISLQLRLLFHTDSILNGRTNGRLAQGVRSLLAPAESFAILHIVSIFGVHYLPCGAWRACPLRFGSPVHTQTLLRLVPVLLCFTVLHALSTTTLRIPPTEYMTQQGIQSRGQT